MIGMAGSRLSGMAVVLLVGVSIVACKSDERATPSSVAPGANTIASSTSISTSTSVPASPVPTQTELPSPTPTPAPTNTPAPTVTATPAVSSTPLPQQTSVLTVTDSQATELATQGLAANPDAMPVPIKNPSVAFTRENIKLTADMQGSRLEVLGTPEVVDGRVAFKLTSLKLNGFEVPFYRREVEDAINGIFTRMLAGRRVKSVQLGNGMLTVTLP